MSKIVEAAVKLTGTVSPELKAACDSAKKTIKSLDFKNVMKSAASAAGSMALAVGKGAIEAGKYLVDLGQQYRDAENIIRLGTGATGDQLQDFMGNMKNVYARVPEDMNTVAGAVADLNTRLGLTGEANEQLAETFLDLSRIAGTDVSSSIEASSKMFQAWGISTEDMAGSMDYLWKANQTTGTSIDKLMSSAQQLAPTFQDLGFDFESSVALMGQLDKSGVDVSSTLSAMKKAVSSLNKDGKSGIEGFQQYCDQIKNTSSEVEAAQLAMEIFGTKAGPTMAKNIREGKFEVQDLVSELKNSQETISAAAEDTLSFSDHLEIFKHSAQNALEPLGTEMLKGLEGFLPALSGILAGITPMISDIATGLAPIMQDAFGTLRQVFEQVSPVIGDALGQIMPLIGELASTMLPPLASIVSTLLPPLMQIGMAILPPMISVITQIIGAVQPIISAILPSLQAMIQAVIPVIQSLMQVGLSIFQSVVVPILGPLGQLVNALLPPLTGLFQGVCNVAGQVLGAMQPVVSVFGSVAGAIGRAVSALGDFLAKAGEVAGGVLGSIGSFLGFAHGGFTVGPSIAGEDPNYPTEAVISFNPAVRSRNLAYWATAGEMLGADVGSFVTSKTDKSNTTIDLSGISFSPNITIHGNGDADSIVDILRSYMPEFVDLIVDAIKEQEEGEYATASFVY